MNKLVLFPFEGHVSLHDDGSSWIKFRDGYIIDTLNTFEKDEKFSKGSKLHIPINIDEEFPYSPDETYVIEIYQHQFVNGLDLVLNGSSLAGGCIYKTRIAMRGTNDPKFKVDEAHIGKTHEIKLWSSGNQYVTDNIIIINPMQLPAGNVYVSSVSSNPSSNLLKFTYKTLPNYVISHKRESVAVDHKNFSLSLDVDPFINSSNLQTPILQLYYRTKLRVSWKNYEFGQNTIEYLRNLKFSVHPDYVEDATLDQVEISSDSWRWFDVDNAKIVSDVTIHSAEYGKELYTNAETEAYNNIISGESSTLALYHPFAHIYKDGMIKMLNLGGLHALDFPSGYTPNNEITDEGEGSCDWLNNINDSVFRWG